MTSEHDIRSHRQKVRLEAQSGYIEWTTLCGCVAHLLLLLFIFENLNDKSNGQLLNKIKGVDCRPLALNRYQFMSFERDFNAK